VTEIQRHAPGGRRPEVFGGGYHVEIGAGVGVAGYGTLPTETVIAEDGATRIEAEAVRNPPGIDIPRGSHRNGLGETGGRIEGVRVAAVSGGRNHRDPGLGRCFDRLGIGKIGPIAGPDELPAPERDVDGGEAIIVTIASKDGVFDGFHDCAGGGGVAIIVGGHLVGEDLRGRSDTTRESTVGAPLIGRTCRNRGDGRTVPVAVHGIVVTIRGVEAVDHLGVGDLAASEGRVKIVDAGVDDGDRRSFPCNPELVKFVGADHLETFNCLETPTPVGFHSCHPGIAHEGIEPIG